MGRFLQNLFAFYNYSLPFALFALLLNLALFVVPPLLALASLLLHLAFSTLILAMLAYALAVLMRLLLVLRFTRRKDGLASFLFAGPSLFSAPAFALARMPDTSPIHLCQLS